MMMAFARGSRSVCVRSGVIRAPCARFSDAFKKRETANEAEFISRMERDNLRKLLSKLDSQADPEGKVSRTNLHVVFEKHNLKLSKALEADLRAWKNDGNFQPVYVD
eukprot:CAMPEP_0175104602 /NCGR_PEP_ID=MMETSP0086_2-20121207/9847_1 /TAXON_ID=136419 /ORGANISM="Unknown Unknown, Strain D1" /LENGTH=106 /DNA_ID=CAMNT_0016380069 /DNA_START=27 /DNA_END=347 /DNA_ORIENTATION=+